uniref:hypothetical protein n=1 Tax=Streptomyces sp. SCSIO 75703 TaxID=3112165 RepID=UPI0040401A7D
MCGFPHRPASAALAVACLAVLSHPVHAAPAYAAPVHRATPARPVHDGSRASTAPAGPSGAECRVRVDGSRVTAHCHNPSPEPDRVALHIECARWWDIDTDGTPAEAAPTRTVELTGRCWKDVDSAWVTHEPAR